MNRFFGHLKTVLKHKSAVFKLCCRFGIPFQGLMHDLSKFSYIEFSESVKYYTDGKKSPNSNAIHEKGYSTAWEHHKRVNKHHFEYWYIHKKTVEIPDMPFKYALEMLADRIAACMIYLNNDYTDSSSYDYFIVRKDHYEMSEGIKLYLEEAFTLLKDKGIKAFNKKAIKEIYNKYIKES